MSIKKETSAGGIVYKRGEKVLWLITQHSQHKGWVFPKGLIVDSVANELMETAALREVEEEGGIKAKIVNPVPASVTYSYMWKELQVDKTVHYFLMEYISGDPSNHDWEMSDAKFVTEEEVKKTLTFPSDQEAFEKILKLFK